MERLDELLLRIIEEPTSKVMSRNEIEFFEKLRHLRKVGSSKYATYMVAYREIHQSKLDDEKYK